MKTLIVISGGGFAQIESGLAILIALEEHGIALHDANNTNYKGTSAGAVLSSLMSAGHSPHSILNIIKKYNSQFIRKHWLWPVRLALGYPIYNRDGFASFLHQLIDGHIYYNVKVIMTRASDMRRTESPAHFLSVLASTSIDLIFPRVTIDNTEYIDGGYTDNVPLEPKDAKHYDRIYLILCPKDADSLRHHKTLIGRALSQLDIKLSQETNESEYFYSDRNEYPNVTVLRPPAFKTSLLSFSKDFSLFAHSYQFAKTVLTKSAQK